MSRSVTKGTKAESAIVAFLKPWWPATERRAKTGNKDRGDIAGVVGQRGKIVIEAKDCVRVELAQWLDEARLEQANDEADVGVVWFKRRGQSDPGKWFVLMDGQTFAHLALNAGYGNPPHDPERFAKEDQWWKEGHQ